MNKADLAGYLVSLHTLIDAQTKGVVSTASKTLADEYERSWKELKETIQKEREDETRNRKQSTGFSEAGTDSESRLTGSSLPTGDTHRRSPSS